MSENLVWYSVVQFDPCCSFSTSFYFIGVSILHSALLLNNIPLCVWIVLCLPTGGLGHCFYFMVIDTITMHGMDVSIDLLLVYP